MKRICNLSTFTVLTINFILIFVTSCKTEDPTLSIHLSTILIPTSTFIMGSPPTEVGSISDETQHPVTLSAFRISKYDITNTQYAAFLNAKGIDNSGRYATVSFGTQTLIYSNSEWGLTYNNNQWTSVTGHENYPVTNVTWYGANEFALYIGGSLPTEAQWEYACRAGTTTMFSTGDCLSNTQANYYWFGTHNTCIDTVTPPLFKPTPVGAYPPNALGLYDMHGNVWQWCSDWYGFYPITDQANPTGSSNGSSRVIRGGSCLYFVEYCRSAKRNRQDPLFHSDDIGFRVVFIP